MSFKSLISFFIIFTVYNFFTFQPVSCELCESNLSINIENGTEEDDGSIFFDGLIFPNETRYIDTEGELLGCPCKVKKCIRKCCGPDEVLDNDYTCSLRNESDFTDVFSNSVDLIHSAINKLDDDFYVIHTMDCATPELLVIVASGEYKLPGENFQIVPNGSLILTQIDKDNNKVAITAYGPERYCIEHLEATNGTIFITCRTEGQLSELKRESIKRWAETATNWFSVIFLIMTFIVYLILPDLRNIHGLTLMSHIACLTVTYTFLPIMKHNEFQGRISKGLCVAVGK